MELNDIMYELKSLGTERTKKIYMSNGAQEPVFGVTINAMKPIFKKIKYNQPLAEQLYTTGNKGRCFYRPDPLSNECCSRIYSKCG